MPDVNPEVQPLSSPTTTPEPTPNRRPRHEFKQLIISQYRKNVEGIFALGRLLIEAKDELLHGEWLYLINSDLKQDLGIGVRMCQMHMKVASHPWLGNAQYIAHLPNSITTLYELCRLPEELLRQLFRRNLISPETECQFVQKYIREWKRDRLDWLNVESHMMWNYDWAQSYPEPNAALMKRIVTDDGFTDDMLDFLATWFPKAARLAWKQERQRLLAEDETMQERIHQRIQERVARLQANGDGIEDVGEDEDDGE